MRMRRVGWIILLFVLVLFLLEQFFGGLFWGGGDPSFLRQPIGTVVGSAGSGPAEAGMIYNKKEL